MMCDCARGVPSDVKSTVMATDHQPRVPGPCFWLFLESCFFFLHRITSSNWGMPKDVSDLTH